MLREISVLTKLNLCNIYGLNVFKNIKDNKERNKSIGIMVAMAFVIAVMAIYVGLLVYGYVTLGISDVIPAYLIMISSLIILFLGIFKAGPVIFERKGYDILCSLPVSSKSIVIARFIRMYVESLLFTLVVMIPGIVVYGFLLKPSISFYVSGLVVTIMLPMAPMTVAVILGAIITALTSKMRYKSLVGAGLSIILVLGIFGFSGKLTEVGEEITPEMMYNFANLITGVIAKLYPPAIWLSGWILGTEYLRGIVFVIGNFVVLGITINITGMKLQDIIQGLYGTIAKNDFQMGKQEQKNVIVALYKKEFKRYFASNIYVTNTVIGPAMGVMMTVALLFIDLDDIANELAILPFEIDIVSLVPIIMSAAFCLMTTSCTSISMEGKEWWIVKSLPLSTKDILDGKLIMNLLLLAPFYLVSEVCMMLALRPEGIDMIWVIASPALLMTFSCVWGIFINLKFPVFNWENEVSVVKQSMAAFVGGMAGMVLAIVCALVLVVTPVGYHLACKIVMATVLIVGTVALYVNNNKVRLEEL